MRNIPMFILFLKEVQFNSYAAILRYLAQIKCKKSKGVLTDWRYPIWLNV